MNDSQKQKQELTLKNRKELFITGVTKLEAMNPVEFSLITTLGRMNIKGNNMEMQMFDIDKGNINITGDIDQITYSNKSTKTKDKGFVQKLFK